MDRDDSSHQQDLLRRLLAETDEGLARWAAEFPNLHGEFAFYMPFRQLMTDGPAQEALSKVMELAEQAPDEDHLAVLAVALVEPLVDIHGSEISEPLLAGLAASANLRRAVRGSILRIPSDVEAELRAAAAAP